MPHYIHKTDFTILKSVDPSQVPAPLADWQESPEGLNDLLAANVPLRHIKAVDVGEGVFAAQEMDQAEKDAVDLPILKAQKTAELELRVREVVRLRFEQGATESDIAAAIDAATTPADVIAIDVNGGDPQDYGKMVGDALYLAMTTPGATVAPADGWVKIPGTTAPLGNSIGKSFVDGGASNRIACAFDGRVRIWVAVSVLFESSAGQADVSLNRANGAPPSGDPSAGLQSAGCRISGAVGQTVCGTLSGPLDISDGDVLEVWLDGSGPGSTAQVVKMQFYAERIPG